MLYDDFDTQITPEELHEPDTHMDDNFETDNDLNAHDWDEEERQWDFVNDPDEPDDMETGDYMVGGGCPYDEGSDRDNWEDQQVFNDHEW